VLAKRGGMCEPECTALTVPTSTIGTQSKGRLLSPVGASCARAVRSDARQSRRLISDSIMPTCAQIALASAVQSTASCRSCRHAASACRSRSSHLGQVQQVQQQSMLA
jgi:hypothetical protein